MYYMTCKLNEWILKSSKLNSNELIIHMTCKLNDWILKSSKLNLNTTNTFIDLVAWTWKWKWTVNCRLIAIKSMTLENIVHDDKKIVFQLFVITFLKIFFWQYTYQCICKELICPVLYPPAKPHIPTKSMSSNLPSPESNPIKILESPDQVLVLSPY